jgi:hypothetical protein
MEPETEYDRDARFRDRNKLDVISGGKSGAVLFEAGRLGQIYNGIECAIKVDRQSSICFERVCIQRHEDSPLTVGVAAGDWSALDKAVVRLNA